MKEMTIIDKVWEDFCFAYDDGVWYMTKRDFKDAAEKLLAEKDAEIERLKEKYCKCNSLNAVCNTHEYLETKLTTSLNDDVDINYQCKHCGHTLSVSEKSILDKAKELYEKFHYQICNDNGISENESSIFCAKQCAKMSIDEIINACEYNYVEFWNTEWWNKVKAQIDGLVV